MESPLRDDVWGVLPYLVTETSSWAVVYKPHGMPSAPLHPKDIGTLTHWYSQLYPTAEPVEGKKKIEKGLIHRLDTDTAGLILFAKTQKSYDSFQEIQKNNQFIKRYFAFTSPVGVGATIQKNNTIQSQFRHWGPGRKEVRAVFQNERLYTVSEPDYCTYILSVDQIKNCDIVSLQSVYAIHCELTCGFRHQVRVHLASRGFPIIGDRLYHPDWMNSTDSITRTINLQLHAISLSFPDPDSNSLISVSLPPPNRMTR